MLQYNGVTGKGSRVPPHGAASSSLGYGLPGSLSQGSLTHGAHMSGGQPPPRQTPFWKVPHPNPNPSPHPVSLTLPLSLTYP